MVYYDNREYEILNTYYDLSVITQEGDYLIEILAVGDGKTTEDSNWSTYYYTLLYIDKTPISPQKPTENLAYKLLKDKSGYEVSKGNAKLTETLVIPSSYNGLPVKKIATNAFVTFKSLFEVIPNTITTTIVIPETVEIIDSHAFQQYTALTNLILSKGLSAIGSYAFCDCGMLKKIQLPEGIITIESSAFENCIQLSEFKLPETLTSLSRDVFKNTAWYNALPDGNVIKDGVYIEYKGTSTDTITISGCRLIADNAFIRTATKNVIIDKGTELGKSVFQATYSLQSVILPSDLKILPEYTFYQSAIEKLQLPEGLTKIEASAFSSSHIKEITFPSSLKTIGDSAFMSSHLQNVLITKNIQLGTGVFSNCQYLESVVVQGTKTIPNATFIGNINLSNVTVLYGTETICDNTFDLCKALEKITLPSSLTTIGSESFSRCTSLTEIVLPSSLTTIGDKAFKSCGLKEITFSAKLETIGEFAFTECANLTRFNWNNTQAKIYSNAFSKCGVNELTISSYLNFDSESHSFFSKCSQLKKVTIEEMTKLPNSIFQGCQALETVTLTQGIIEIENGAFSNCTSLNQIALPDSLKIIEQGAFSRCTSLAQISLPPSLEKIGQNAFSFCDGLTSVILPENLTTVESRVFNGCKNLTNIVLGAKTLNGISNLLNSSYITDIYFYGDKNEWDDCLPKDYTLPESVTVYFYTNDDTAPTDGNRYWHYLTDKDIEILN